MIEFYRKDLNDKLTKLECPEAGALIFALDPTQEDLNYLCENFKLERNAVEDWMDENELPHIEKDENVTHIIIRIPFVKDNAVATTPVLLAMAEENVVILSRVSGEIFEPFFKERCEFCTPYKTQFVLKIFAAAIASFDHQIKKAVKDIKAKRIDLSKLNNGDILDLVRHEETLNDFISSFVPFTSVLEKVLTGKFFPLNDDDRELVDDLMVDSKQTLTLCVSSVKSISTIREAYSAILTNSLNRTMKALTGFTILFMVPNIISSFFGMNVGLPRQQDELAFIYIAILSLVSAILLAWIFYKKKWL
ncbi:MAG: magnesium transporter CorA family protein [Patescibacteria group bacterium]|nr:magnesium transporter CorA family protein [Patescibacteria group bacterium]